MWLENKKILQQALEHEKRYQSRPCSKFTMADEKKKIKTTEEDYNKALASEDPTKITKEEQERLTREAIKKFKSLS